LRRSGLRKTQSDAALYEVLGHGVLYGEDRRTGAIIKAKRDVFAQITPRPPGELLLDAHNADGRTMPLRCRRQVEQVTQELCLQLEALSERLPIKHIALFGNISIVRTRGKEQGA
jgi:hypothetical protein